MAKFEDCKFCEDLMSAVYTANEEAYNEETTYNTIELENHLRILHNGLEIRLKGEDESPC